MAIQSFVERCFPTCITNALYPDDVEQDYDASPLYASSVQEKIQFNINKPTHKDGQTIYNCKVLAQFNPETQILCSAHIREDKDDVDYEIVLSSMNKTAAKVISFFYSVINCFLNLAGKDEITNPYRHTKESNEYLLMDLEQLYSGESDLAAKLTTAQSNTVTDEGIDNTLHKMLKQAREHLQTYHQVLENGFRMNLSRLDTAIATIGTSEKQFARACGIQERSLFGEGIPSFPSPDEETISYSQLPPCAQACSRRLNELNTEFYRDL